MNGANQVRARIREVETEVASDIRLGPGGFFHPLRQFNQYNFIPGGWLVRGSVFECASERFCGDRRAQHEHESKRERKTN